MTLEQHYVELTDQDRDASMRRILDADDEMTRLVLQQHTADGMRYQTAVTELLDCQGWIKDQP